MTETFARRFTGTAALLALAALGALLGASCSQTPRDPERIVRKLVHAHGGRGKIERLQTFTGKGFIKDLSDTVVVKSNAFDVYRSRERYKHLILRTAGGRLGDVIALCRNAEGTWTWRTRGGLMRVSPMELELIRYRFPMVLSWVQEKGRSPELLAGEASDRDLRVRYRVDDVELTLAVDRKTWLLDGVEIRTSADTTFLFAERYDAYMDLDGIPFPQRNTATYRDMPLYEYVLSNVELRSDLPDSLFTLTGADTVRVR